MQRNKSRKNKKLNKNKKLMLFLRTFLISTGVLIVIVFSGWVFLRSWIKPPDIPVQAAEDGPLLVEDGNEPAFLLPHGDEADKNIGNGLAAPERFTSSDRKDSFYTFLVVGLDVGVQTDTIMVASYDSVNKSANIIAIPRDSLVNVKRKVKKINSAYGAGFSNGGGREGGIEQLKREIKTIIGFMPDFYIMVDLNAFVKIVDAVNGVDVYVPMNMDYDDPTPGQDLHIHFSKGLQTLNGKQALEFARYRKNNDKTSITDYQRIENQQAVIKAMLEKLLKPESILRVREFIDIFNENVYSDIKPENMLWFADELNQVRGTDALSMYTIPTTGTSGLPDYVEFLDEAGIVELVNRTINPYIKDIEAKDLDIITKVP